MLDQTVELCLADKAKKLKDACRTRWIQRIDSYTVFMELLCPCHGSTSHGLPNLHCDWDWDGETVTKATGFLHPTESPFFLAALKILLEVLANLRGLTLKLQMEAGDVVYVYNEVKGKVN